MIKKALFTLLLTLAAVTVSGRGLIDLGIKAGVTTDNYKFFNKNQFPSQFGTDSKLGMQVGAIARINLFSFHIQPEILYTMNRYKLTSTPWVNGMLNVADQSSGTVRTNSFQVPVLFGMKIPFLRFQAGPMFNLSTDPTVKNNKNVPFDVKTIKPAVSYVLGIGVDLFRIELDFRYNGQFARTIQDINMAGETIRTRGKDNVWMFSVGWIF